MNYSFLDRHEYNEIPLLKIEDNKNGLPFFIIRMDRCNTGKHRHKFVQIVYVSKGRLKHVLNDNIFDLYMGDIFVIPPFVPHHFIDEYDEKFEIIEFEFIPEFINEKFSQEEKAASFLDFAYLEPFLVSENMVKPRLNLTGSLKATVEDIFSEVLREYESRDSDFELIIKGLLLRLLILVGREFRKDITGTESQRLFERHRNAIYSAMEHIKINSSKDITFEEAAKIAMLSPSYFRYLFKQLTGKTFIEYLNCIRIAKAVDMIKSKPGIRIVDVCFEVGYNNINHFNRVFREETGLTPTMVKKSKSITL